MDAEAEGASGTWLAAPRELRELHKDAIPSSPDRGGALRPTKASKPRPPPPAPSEDDVLHLKAALLERGIYETEFDPVSKRAFYYDVRSGAATWYFHSLCEVQYDALMERLQSTDLHNASQSKSVVTPLPRRRVAGTSSPPSQKKQQSPSAAAVARPTGTSATNISQTQWREKVIDLYRTYDASKISLVDELLGRYRGREDELWRHLKSKYASPPSKASASVKGPHHVRSSPLRHSHDDVPTVDEGTCTLDTKDLDVYMHHHHGDTHGVSYRSLSNSSSKSPPRPTEEAPPAPTTGYCGISDTAVLVTPNVSTIDGESEPDEAASQREALAAARAAAEAKAHKILYASGGNAVRKAKVVASNTAAASSSKDTQPSHTTKSSQQVWSQELSRREEQLAARRLFVQQERNRAKATREEEMRRRAEELKRIREAEEEARRLATPKRLPQADPNIERPSSAKRPHSARQRHRDASPIAAAVSARPNTGRQQDDDRPLASGASPSPGKHQRKLSASEMRSSVERLYQRSSGNKL